MFHVSLNNIPAKKRYILQHKKLAVPNSGKTPWFSMVFLSLFKNSLCCLQPAFQGAGAFPRIPALQLRPLRAAQLRGDLEGLGRSTVGTVGQGLGRRVVFWEFKTKKLLCFFNVFWCFFKQYNSVFCFKLFFVVIF